MELLDIKFIKLSDCDDGFYDEIVAVNKYYYEDLKKDICEVIDSHYNSNFNDLGVIEKVYGVMEKYKAIMVNFSCVIKF